MTERSEHGAELETLVAAAERARSVVLSSVSSLSDRQGAFAPDGAWSVAEIVEHLYFAEMTGLSKIWEAADVRPGRQPLDRTCAELGETYRTDHRGDLERKQRWRLPLRLLAWAARWGSGSSHLGPCSRSWSRLLTASTSCPSKMSWLRTFSQARWMPGKAPGVPAVPSRAAPRADHTHDGAPRVSSHLRPAGSVITHASRGRSAHTLLPGSCPERSPGCSHVPVAPKTLNLCSSGSVPHRGEIEPMMKTAGVVVGPPGQLGDRIQVVAEQRYPVLRHT